MTDPIQNSDLGHAHNAGALIAKSILDMKCSIERLGAWLPVPVIALDRLPGRLIGLSMGMFVLVRSDFAADRPTIVHELEHCRQFWRGGLILHMAKYYLSRQYRLRAEVEAFRAELAACCPQSRQGRLEESARVLAACYEIDLDEAACRRMLSGDSLPDGPSGSRESPVRTESNSPLPTSPLAARAGDLPTV